MIRGAAISAILTLLATAQESATPRTGRQASKAMHAAWLREVMDGDVAGAVQAYGAIAANDDANNPQRWIAVARLLELQRLGVTVPPTTLDKTAPAPLRPAFEAARQPLPVPVAELLRRTTQAPEQVRQTVSSESGRLPPLRPATADAQEWVRDRLRAPSGRPRPGGPGGRNRTDRAGIARWQAADILQRELEGRQEQAESLRKYYFPEWRAPAVPTDAQGAIPKVHAGIEAWIADREVSLTQQNLLRSLREAFDQRAAIDPVAALTFVARMPLYADRLLGAPAGAASSSR